MFNWKATDKYDELVNFEMEVKNIFVTKSFDIEGNGVIISNYHHLVRT